MTVLTRTAGLVLVEHEIEVPLDHDDPGGQQITVFAREVSDPDGRERPFLLFLQGGPGHEAPRPTRHPTSPAWLDRALADYRVLLLDQRGTGRSTPVGTLAGRPPHEQARHLSLLRADSIVRDAEALRQALGVDRWSVLGQSFGGFCALRYLSAAPDALREAFFTGGLPPVGRHPDEVYAATYERMLDRNARYFTRYPGDLERVRQLQHRLTEDDVRLPTGDRLTVRLLRQLGSLLGMSDGAEHLHHLLELPADSPAFLHDVAAALPFNPRNPLYTLVHEACYADGTTTRWSAQRTLPAVFEQQPELFTGEHVHPWLLEDHAALTPLREAAHLLAEHPWPRLYDPEQLARNEVPAAAAVYADDPYVEHRFSMETAALVRGLRPWVTNEYEHNGLRVDGGRILDRLIDLARGRA
ncbi:MAG TPA: alpha/beta fold hydrolase [Actinomycetales bacterium]|jgi:pimeloyl-ACP methyl ester carboxylesterase